MWFDSHLWENQCILELDIIYAEEKSTLRWSMVTFLATEKYRSHKKCFPRWWRVYGSQDVPNWWYRNSSCTHASFTWLTHTYLKFVWKFVYALKSTVFSWWLEFHHWNYPWWRFKHIICGELNLWSTTPSCWFFGLHTFTDFDYAWGYKSIGTCIKMLYRMMVKLKAHIEAGFCSVQTCV